MHKGGNPEEPRILFLETTGIAAINIVGGKMYPLNDCQRGILRDKLSKVKFITIDKILIVSNVLLYQEHQRLNEIFECLTVLQFAGLPVDIQCWY